MSDDDILKEIGKALSEPDALDDPGWEKLQQGLADEDQERELAELERRHPHISGAGQAFQPLSQDFQSRLEALVQGNASSGQSDNVSILRPRTQKRRYAPAIVTTAVAALAAAAALILVLLPQTPTEIGSYHYEFSGGERAMRGLDSPERETVPVFTKSSVLEMRIRPERANDVPVRVHGFLIGPNTSEKISLPFQVSKSGVILVRGRVSDLFQAQPGQYHLVVVVTADDTDVPPPTEPLMGGARRVNAGRFDIVQPLQIRDGP